MYLNIGWIVAVFIIPCVLLAIYVYEHARASTAGRLGVLRGNISSRNPLRYYTVFGTLLMIFTGYGWGKQQECDLTGLSKGKKVLYYFSGSLGNIICALAVMAVQGVIFCIMLYASLDMKNPIMDYLNMSIDIFVVCQLLMAIAQLVPIPGFAGYSILKTLFFENYYHKNLTKIENSGKWIFTIAALAGLLNIVSEIPADFLFSVLTYLQEGAVDLITGGLWEDTEW